jgi:cellulose synthase/poly-beta-1,6-N-acetylglucosamine synthase-like glycosyltransferase
MIALCVCVCICAALSVFYLSITFFLFLGLRHLTRETRQHILNFSIVIAARNEEKNIGACLGGVLDQSIGRDRYEAILVNDRSTDATAKICGGLAKRFPNLTVISVSDTPAGVSPKKYAIQQGINRAKNEIIVFTDADCRVPEKWLEAIDRYMTSDTGFVQGITAYAHPAGLNRLFFGLQALDFCSHAVVSAAAIGAGLPLNSNANNLAFRKKAFDEVAGYGADATVVSGDDDMLLQRIWKKTQWRIRYMADLSGAVTTSPTTTLAGVFEQRKRWGSKTIHYGWRQVSLLSGVFAFYCAIIALICIGAFRPIILAVAAGMLLVKMAGEVLLMIPGTRIMGQKHLRKYLPLGSLLQLPVVIVATVLGVFGRFVWKDQTFNRRAHS